MVKIKIRCGLFVSGVVVNKNRQLRITLVKMRFVEAITIRFFANSAGILPFFFRTSCRRIKIKRYLRNMETCCLPARNHEKKRFFRFVDSKTEIFGMVEKCCLCQKNVNEPFKERKI
jgi:hypothetical protein